MWNIIDCCSCCSYFGKPTMYMTWQFWVYRKLMWNIYVITEPVLASTNYPVSVFFHFIQFCYSFSFCHCTKSDREHLGTEAIFVLLCTIHPTCTWGTQNIIEFHKIIKLRRKYHKSSLSCEVSDISITVYVQKYHVKNFSHFTRISVMVPIEIRSGKKKKKHTIVKKNIIK